MLTREWVQGDTEPLQMKVTQRDGVTPLNLLGASGTFSMWDASTGAIKVNAAAIDITSPTAGEWEYRWAAGDVAAAGRYYARATFVRSGKVISTERFSVVIEALVH